MAKRAKSARSLPTQVCTWLPRESNYAANPPRDSQPSDVGQWLYCLKATERGDRQIVWSGVHGDGLFAVVDFTGEVRARVPNEDGKVRRGYEGWGRITALRRFLTVEQAQRDRVLRPLFMKSIQGVWSLTDREARTIDELTGGLPAAANLDGCEPDWAEPGGGWAAYPLPPEEIVERIVLGKPRVARKLGFASKVNPKGTRHGLANGDVPDFWCAEDVVGDAKNQVTSTWGPEQIERYIKQCDRQWPEHRPWRGVLVQGVPAAAPSGLKALRKSRYRDRITLWSLEEADAGRVKATQLFP